MTTNSVTCAVVVLVVAVSQSAAQAPVRRNFVACPVVQDTRTVPCWMSEDDGELYYLGIQTDISAEFHPPYLGHKVLVEGTVSNEPRICGGVVLKPVRVSPLPELDGSCNTILPAVDQYTVPFAPRPPGPSGGRLAFQDPPPATTSAPAKDAQATGPKEFALQYDLQHAGHGPACRRSVPDRRVRECDGRQAPASHRVSRIDTAFRWPCDGRRCRHRGGASTGSRRIAARRGPHAAGHRGGCAARTRTRHRSRRLAVATHNGAGGTLRRKLKV